MNQPLLQVALFEPEIPPNTGNIIRLCANCGADLHLIHPLGFDLSDKQMRRAGLDYHEWANIKHYDNFDDFIEKNNQARLIACTTKTKHHYTQTHYRCGDILLFGPESRGLPDHIRLPIKDKVRIPMLAHSRSLNLANAVSIIIYEAWRQNDFHQ